MPRIAMLAALVLLAAAPPRQDSKGGKCCDEKGPKPWPDYNKGVKWTLPFDAAVKTARESNKLLMVFHLVGDMSKEGC